VTTVLNERHGERLKTEGMQQALDFSGPWGEAVVLELTGWLATQKAMGIRDVTIEQFRAQASNQPESHKAWGSLPGMACKANLLRPKWAAPGVQARIRAAAPKTHAHEVKVWEIV